tara:strand:+ start:631 stop:858 length:228 start_codon:yes stop_codon:yes gene_type:complete
MRYFQNKPTIGMKYPLSLKRQRPKPYKRTIARNENEILPNPLNELEVISRKDVEWRVEIKNLFKKDKKFSNRFEN